MLGGADGVFGEIVIKLDLAVEEAGLKMWPFLAA
jgi:hypothetical protein